MATLGDRLRRARIERGVTEAELATRLGIRQSAVSMLEAGEMEPSDDLVTRVKAWLASGGGTTKAGRKSGRGPYRKGRATLPKYQ